MTAEPIIEQEDGLEVDPLDPIPTPGDFPTGFDDVQIDRVLARLGALRRSQAAVDHVADARIADIEAWREHRLAVHAAAIDHRLAFLQAIHEHRLREDPKAKSISLPSGTLKSRASAERVEVVDAGDFVEWARVNAPELVREKTVWEPEKKVLPGPLRMAETEGGPVVVDSTSGDVVPGVVWRPASRKFTVDTPEAGA